MSKTRAFPHCASIKFPLLFIFFSSEVSFFLKPPEESLAPGSYGQ